MEGIRNLYQVFVKFKKQLIVQFCTVPKNKPLWDINWENCITRFCRLKTICCTQKLDVSAQCGQWLCQKDILEITNLLIAGNGFREKCFSFFVSEMSISFVRKKFVLFFPKMSNGPFQIFIIFYAWNNNLYF